MTDILLHTLAALTLEFILQHIIFDTLLGSLIYVQLRCRAQVDYCSIELKSNYVLLQVRSIDSIIINGLKALKHNARYSVARRNMQI